MRSATRSYFVAGLLAAVGLSAAPARAHDWGTPGLDATHARLSDERSGALFADRRWTSAGAGARMLASPVVADGFVVTSDLGGSVKAMREDDGQVVWQTSVGSSVQGTPALIRGRVYVPTLGNNVTALHLADGTVAWTRDVGGMTLSSPTPIDDDIVVAVGFPQRHIARLSGLTGELIWQSPPVMAQFGNTSPAVAAGVVVVGSNGGKYYGFDAVTGLLRWDYAGDGIVHLAAPLLAAGRVYMAGGGDSGRVHAVDLATGTPLAGWPVELPAPEPDIVGSRMGRQRAVSSFVSLGGTLVIQTRLDDALDTNADGAIDLYLSRETVLALDAASGALVWQQPVARAELKDPNEVPKLFVCPTPAAYATDAGAPLLAVTSSLDAVLFVLDAASGRERARHATAGAALASPVMTNGRVITSAMSGTTQALTSSTNHAPAAPTPATYPVPLDSANLVLRWLPGVDPDGELASYQLRIDADGELLENWQQELPLAAGATSARLAAALQTGVVYSFALRARDARGAWSPWSDKGTFTVVENPPVTVGGKSVTGLADALALATPGDVVKLGAGTYRLSETMVVRGGVSIQGAGAGRTLLDASGLGTGIVFDGSDGAHRTQLEGVTVAGADTCVRVGEGTTGVSLSHVVVRDCPTHGVSVAATGGAELTNATLVGNGAAVNASGSTRVKNSLLTDNGTALQAAKPAAIVSSYNDLHGNQTNYSAVEAGTGDLAIAVTFADATQHDLRILVAQATTDRGDPADAVGDEPAPNGGRINLGAFGGTSDAEKSALSRTDTGSLPGATPVSDPKPVVQPPADEPDPSSESGGCALGGQFGADGVSGILLVCWLARRRTRRRYR